MLEEKRWVSRAIGPPAASVPAVSAACLDVGPIAGAVIDVSGDEIDSFRKMEREIVAPARADYAARVAGLLDAEL